MLQRLTVGIVLLCAATYALFGSRPSKENRNGPPLLAADAREHRTKTDDRLQVWQLRANRAAVVAALLTALTLLATVIVYLVAANRDADANTVAMMRNHLQIFWEHPELRSCASFAATPTDPKCLSVAEDAVFTAETIIRLRGDDSAWEASAASLVCEYQWWFAAQRFHRPSYYRRFVEFVDRELPNCRKSALPWPPVAPTAPTTR